VTAAASLGNLSRLLAAALAAGTLSLSGASLAAQGPPGAPAAPPPSPQASAPLDLTGYWVAIVNEDWRWRMVTPPQGDFPGIPLNEQGRKVAMAWNPETDGSCLAFGAAALLRMPTRMRITWENERTLKLETDNGQQTRRFHFDARAAQGPRSLQGNSVAEWRRTLAPSNPFGINAPGGPPGGPGGSLKVVTTNLRAAWLRRNGVPYSERAVVTEHFDRFPAPDGSEWLAVTTVVEDPMYLLSRFVTSSHFRREPDGSKWSPRPCRS
jgi:hypothetical protein